MPSNTPRPKHRTFLRSLLRAVLLVAGTAMLVQARGQESPFAPQPDTVATAEFGAIAFTGDGSFSAVWKRKSKSDAEAQVLADCAKLKRGACQVVGFRQELCAAIATFRTGKDLTVTYAGGGVTKADAQRAALERCNGDDRARRTCQIRTTVCGDGR
jgi:Domain of unknown function (DUF4189)